MQWTDDEKMQVMEILAKLPFSVIAFGSRVRNTARPDSDLDLCLDNGESQIPLHELAMLRETFENSRLPFVVDLVDYSQLNTLFQQKIREEGVHLTRKL